MPRNSSVTNLLENNGVPAVVVKLLAACKFIRKLGELGAIISATVGISCRIRARHVDCEVFLKWKVLERGFNLVGWNWKTCIVVHNDSRSIGARYLTIGSSCIANGINTIEIRHSIRDGPGLSISPILTCDRAAKMTTLLLSPLLETRIRENGSLNLRRIGTYWGAGSSAGSQGLLDGLGVEGRMKSMHLSHHLLDVTVEENFMTA
jgi:hypothetical protein